MVANLIGALTIKSYSFKARSWEFINFNSIDFFDSMASNIKIEVRGHKILRVLPRQNDLINDNWITDKARFALDSLYNQRLTSLIRKTSLHLSQSVSFSKFIQYTSLEIFFFFFLKKHSTRLTNEIFGLTDSLITTEVIIFFKDLLTKLGSQNLIPSLFNSSISPKNLIRSTFIFNNNFSKILSSELYFFIGLNPRLESPILNLKLRKIFLKNNAKFFSFTPINNPNFEIQLLGNNIKAFLDFCEGRHPFLVDLFAYNSYTFLAGNSLLHRKDYDLIMSLFLKLQNILPKFSFYFVYNKLTSLSILEYGFIPSKFSNKQEQQNISSGSSLFFNLNTSNFINSSVNLPLLYSDWARKDVSIFFGSFGVEALKSYDYLFPLANILETGGSFTNLLGLKDIVPPIITPLNGVYSFYAFYSVLLNYCAKFRSSVLLLSKEYPDPVIRLRQLGISDVLMQDVSSDFSTPPLCGILSNNLINSFYVNSFNMDEYSSNSLSMHKAKKNYLSLYSSLYF